MHAVKGGWVGQTFALAKQNEYGGKKSRIRRSKEERKGMVESFIKKYQSLNNGNFPSLNITHKEVGGSFYLIREIVRDIIQENRVLGPATLLPEEQDTDQLLEQYPLGTIATDIQSSSRNGNAFTPTQCPSTTGEPDLISDGLGDAPNQHSFLNGQIVNGTHVIAKDEDSDDLNSAKVEVVEPLETEKSTEEVAASGPKATQMIKVEASESLANEKSMLEVADSGGKATQIAEVQVSELLETMKNVEGEAASEAKIIAEVQVSEPLETKKGLEKVAASAQMAEFQVSEPLKTEKSVEEVAASGAKVLQIEEVRVSEILEAMKNVEGEAAPEDKIIAEVQLSEPMETEKSVEKVATSAQIAEVQISEPLKTEKSVEEVAELAQIAKVQVSEPLITEKRVEEVAVSGAKVTQMTDVIVETFPLRPVTKPTHYLDGNSGEVGDSNGILEEKQVKKMQLESGNDSSLSEGVPSGNSYLLDDKGVENTASSLLERNSGLVDEKIVEYLAHPSLGSSSSPTGGQGIVHDAQVDVDAKMVLSQKDKTTAETKVVAKAPNTAGSQSKTQKDVIQNKADVERSGSSQKGSDPTLDRINLESWQKTSRNAAESETNPLWAIFKGFIAAFMKFWSE